jgi:hypothetical protein
VNLSQIIWLILVVAFCYTLYRVGRTARQLDRDLEDYREAEAKGEVIDFFENRDRRR